MSFKEIYLLHEYGDETHFKALYECSELYGYKVKGMVILSKYQIVKKFVKKLYHGKIFDAICSLLRNLYFHFILHLISDKIMIVGIAPYDKLLNKYSTILKKNKAFYFTSWPYWDGSFFPKGSVANKELFERGLSDCFLGAFCVNEASEKQVQKFVSKTSVVHHSIDIGDYQKKENLNKIVRPLKFVFLGSFDSRKNVPLILDWISKSTNCFEFHFIGKGELSNKIKEMAIKDKRVHYEGFISKKEIKKRLCEYDFLVLPSKEEPFGIVLIEAFSAGVPCIVSNAPGPREIVCDGMTGFLFDLKNEKANFASVMDKIFCLKDEKISSMRKYAALEAEKYDTRNVVKLWIDLMDSCK